MEVEPVPSQEKKERVKQIKKWFEQADSLLVLHYRGLKVSEANELRVQVKGMNSELRVLKNTLARIALAGTPNEELATMLEGPVAVVFVREDPAPAARSLRDFARGRDDFYLLGGMLEGRVLTGREVEAFALLPPREVLVGMALGCVASPLSGLVGVMAGPLRKMLGVMQAIADKKAPAADEAEAADQPLQTGPGEADAQEAPQGSQPGQSVPENAQSKADVKAEETAGNDEEDKDQPEDSKT